MIETTSVNNNSCKLMNANTVVTQLPFFNSGGGNAALQVLAWPVNGRPGKVDVLKSSPRSTTWIKAQITFRKIDDFFIILFRATAPNLKEMDVSLDDVSVTDGRCDS